MEKLDMDKLEKVSGGKIEIGKLSAQELHTKIICDDCGKLITEVTQSLTDPSIVSTKGKEFDCGFMHEDTLNLCADCHHKRMEKERNGM